jgi:hypothetical protein
MTKHLYVVLVLSLLSQMVASAELTTYRCSYERYANGEKIQNVEKLFELVFITDPAGKATLVGNQGSSEVKGFWNKSGGGVSFIEVTPVGNIMTTVVDSKHNSIHSRHTIINGEVVPSQYYGQCKVQ